MTDYDNISKLLQFLGAPNYPIMHWSDNIGWEMATYMHEVVVNKIRNLVQRFNSFPFLVMRSQLGTNNHGF
jgi:hypothetical protein